MNRRSLAGLLCGAVLLWTIGCADEPTRGKPDPIAPPDTLVLQVPGFPLISMPPENALTRQGVELGRRLFHDPIFSADSTQACATCHRLGRALSDTSRFSLGIDGQRGDRNAPAIINPAWGRDFFWDGRSHGLEAQAMEPVKNPIEMHENWDHVVAKLRRSRVYPDLFERAFLTRDITEELAVKAIAQFERTIVSDGAKFDRVRRNEANFTDSEFRGYNLFFTEKADCFHCHGNVLFTDLDFHNVGLETVPIDRGRGKVTNDPRDEGEFKTPTLRNLAFTAPYMHDGRYRTLPEVIEHYNSGGVESPNRSPFVRLASNGGLRLTDEQKTDLLNFLLTLTDSSFVRNPAYQNPFAP